MKYIVIFPDIVVNVAQSFQDDLAVGKFNSNKVRLFLRKSNCRHVLLILDINKSVFMHILWGKKEKKSFKEKMDLGDR